MEKIWPEIKNLDNDTKEQIQIESIYSSYLSRQRADIDDFKKEEGLKIPKIIEYKKVGSLSNEIIEKVNVHLKKKDQILFFLNRRGFSPNVLCKKCYNTFSCPNCSV